MRGPPARRVRALNRRGLAAGALCVLGALVGCTGQTQYIGADQPAAGCNATPAPPPAGLGLDPFYVKYLDATGIPVLGSQQPADAALSQACIIVVRMLAHHDMLRQALIADNMRVAVIARDEVTTDIPEYGDLYTAFPNTDWDTVRGAGATLARPVTSAGEENLLCDGGDPYRGENVLVQVFASAIHLGASAIDSNFDGTLSSDYQSAMAAGLWANTYADMNAGAYFAEGVQDWFDANAQATPPNGVQNAVNTRAELQSYDPTLAALVGSYLPSDDWRAVCP